MTAMFGKYSTKFTYKAMQHYAVLAFSFLLLVFLLPANAKALHDYHLSILQYRIILFAVGIPLLFAWLVAFYGYSKLEEYAYIIRKSPESGAFDNLARGCKWLAWSLSVPVIISLLTSAIANQWNGFSAAAVIIANYSYLIFPLVGFSIIGLASRELISKAKIQFSAISARWIMLLFVIGGALYCYLTFRRFDPGSLGSTNNPYHLPFWLALITVITPYLYAWFIGLLASYEIALYSKQVRGVLYRQALHLMLAGLISVILGSIALQYIRSLQPTAGHLSINYRLLFIIILYVVDGIGFALLAIGAARLKKIEEV